MDDVKVNREYKSSIFAILFGSEEYKQNLLDLYNALADTNYTNFMGVFNFHTSCKDLF